MLFRGSQSVSIPDNYNIPIRIQIIKAICKGNSVLWECLSQNDALFEFGSKLKADKVLSVQLASLGTTTVIKIRIGQTSSNTLSSEVANIKDLSKQSLLSYFPLLQNIDPYTICSLKFICALGMYFQIRIFLLKPQLLHLYPDPIL